MIPASLQPIIRATLASHHVTSDQLLALLNTDADIRESKLSKPRLLSVLRGMVARGEVEVTIDPQAGDGVLKRYRAPVNRYIAWTAGPAHAWAVHRTENATITGRLCTVIGDFMTEAEARVCATALNALDRKANALYQRQKGK